MPVPSFRQQFSEFYNNVLGAAKGFRERFTPGKRSREDFEDTAGEDEEALPAKSLRFALIF